CVIYANRSNPHNCDYYKNWPRVAFKLVVFWTPLLATVACDKAS
nr:hypothetical protein [Tanacetum cinerariifolium]